MKVLVDMNLSPRWVDVLAQSGIETAHWSRVMAVELLDRALLTIEPGRTRLRLLPLRRR
jgi:predicted nuclease of predicted toxin-antitoxin system